jgi:UDP-N-acetylmuramoyl-tripeptide--D-alanyl-D-alanine ligase
MIAAILGRKYPEGEFYPGNAVLKTVGNFNNLIGLPLSLLPIGVHEKVAVLEMGMNIPGEIKRLTEIADPDISCITNIHGAHLLGLGTIEGVADAKEELFNTTKKSGIFIVNLDDARVAERAEKYEQEKVTFGFLKGERDKTPDVYATNISMLDGGAITFTLHHGDRSQDIHLYIAGEHNVTNALCAAATSLAANCSLDEIAMGLADFRAPDKRMELFTSSQGFLILNDTYNANPASMAAGLRTLASIGKARRIAVIGDMLELGDGAILAHYEIGKLAADLQLDQVVCYGEFRGDIIKGLQDAGFEGKNVINAATKVEVENYIKDQVTTGGLGAQDLVLFKASRGLRFETIVECFR